MEAEEQQEWRMHTFPLFLGILTDYGNQKLKSRFPGCSRLGGRWAVWLGDVWWRGKL